MKSSKVDVYLCNAMVLHEASSFKPVQLPAGGNMKAALLLLDRTFDLRNIAKLNFLIICKISFS